MEFVKKDGEGSSSVLDAGKDRCVMEFIKKDHEGRPSILDTDIVKVVVIGEVQCGKTSFIRSFYDHHEPGEIYSHNGVQVYPCEFEINKIHGKAEIFEIPSDVAFKDEQRMQHYTDAKGIIFMYASDNPTSLKLINEKWLPEAIHIINLNKTSVVLVGTKKDLQQDPQVMERLALVNESPVTCEQGKKLFERHQILSSRLFLEYSINDLEVVNQAFNFVFDFALFEKRLHKWMQYLPCDND